jgi:hypothetical protein
MFLCINLLVFVMEAQCGLSLLGYDAVYIGCALNAVSEELVSSWTTLKMTSILL